MIYEKKLAILLSTVLCLCCDEGVEEVPIDVLEVTTAGISCGMVLIDFQKNDFERIKKLTRSDWLRYRAHNLDNGKFSTDGQALVVKVRKTFESDLPVCTLMEPTYPIVTVVEAELKD
ncbi:MAG TPA: hypothetical protein VEB86_01355 [Chryseosolibacter sp.]|nr:hypothetical protein [Chryseosolibacter sp.]